MWVEESTLSRSRVMFRGIRMLLSQQVAATTKINTEKIAKKEHPDTLRDGYRNIDVVRHIIQLRSRLK